MPNFAIVFGLVLIFACGFFVLRHPQDQAPQDQWPEDDAAIVQPELVSLDEYEAEKRKKRASLVSIIVAVILAVVLRAFLN